MLTRPQDCRGCPLDREPGTTGFSRPDGRGTLGLMVILEALGEHEARDGLPLRPYAPAGSVFELALRRCKNPFGTGALTREQLLITNTLQCRPPGNWLVNAPWEIGAIQHCKVHRDRIFERAKPRAILAMGDTALRTETGLAGKNRGVGMLRGYVLEGLRGVPVIPTFHPSFLRRGKQRSEETGAKTESGAGRGGMHLIGVMRHDILKAVMTAQQGFEYTRPTYQTRPGLDDARSFLYRARDNARLPITYDIETPESAKLDEEDLEKAGGQIVSIQFALEPGTGIFFPFEGEYVEIAKELMALPNVKAGWNSKKFDDPRLRGAGFRLEGALHDLMEMWKRMQPDLPAGVQFVSSFYDFPCPWKHLADSEPEHYGCCDVDAPQRILAKLPTDMEKRGCWRSYLEHVFRFEPLLSGMHARGIRIDNNAREALSEKVDQKVAELDSRIQGLVPDKLRPLHPKEGYKKEPKEAVEGAATSIRITRKGGRVDWPARWAKREFEVQGINEDLEETIEKVERWAKVLDFNPGSPDQLKAYMKHQGHKVPRDRRNKETTAKMELERLAGKTGDPLYRTILERRKYDKIKNTYVTGWAPGEDGRVHPQFYHEGATGQMSARRPNSMNFLKHGDLAKLAREMIVASPGHLLVELDFKSAHALTTGFEAQDETYMRLARIDMHSFLAVAGLLKLRPAQELLALPDHEMKAYFKGLRKSDKLYLDAGLKRRIKQAGYGIPETLAEARDADIVEMFGLERYTFQYIRNRKAKPAILGYGFGMGHKTLYYQNMESYEGERETKKVLKELNGLFSKAARWRNDIQRKTHQQDSLTSLHGSIRWFHDVFHWDSRRQCMVPGDDSEAAIAFLPANDAHQHLKDAMIRLGLVEMERGPTGHPLDWKVTAAPGSPAERFGLINMIHDAVLFDCPKGEVAECARVVKAEMEKPSEILVNPVAPEGLWIETDVSVGEDWAHMDEVTLEELEGRLAA